MGVDVLCQCFGGSFIFLKYVLSSGLITSNETHELVALEGISITTGLDYIHCTSCICHVRLHVKLSACSSLAQAMH